MSSSVYFKKKTEEIDEKLVKLLVFYGLAPKPFNEFQPVDEKACLFINCNSLENEWLSKSNIDLLISRFSYIFLYNMSLASSRTIEWLTNGKISVLHIKADRHEFKVSSDHREICGTLTGLSFNSNYSENNFQFRINDISCDNLIMISGRPFFIRFKINKCNIFAVANNKIINIHQDVAVGFKIIKHFSEFVPILMFLKSIFKDGIWHTSDQFACFMIDDPLLRKRYGFLNYEKLLAIMDYENFCSNIAFIPYNWKKSSEDTTHLINERHDRYSISMHGCDHSKAEFGITDEKELNRRINLALSRMAFLEKETNVKFDNVFIFPQGIFSIKALKLLKANNLLGSINTEAFPNDGTGLKIIDFLTPAIMRFFHFPVFIRKYLHDVNEFALDLFMDKPIFLVEHHTYLRDDYQALSQFIKKINLLSSDIKWKSPKYILENFYLRKSINPNTEMIKMLCASAIIRNRSDIKKRYIIVKNEQGDMPIDKCLINDKEAEYLDSVDDTGLKFVIEISGKNQTEIEIFYQNQIGKSENPRFLFRLRIQLRRFLSEVRATTLVYIDFFYQKIKSRLGI